MALEPKVLAAISAAIEAYLQDEEAMLAAAAVAAPPAVAVAIPSTVQNIWGLAGRQLGMQLRLLCQRRTLK